MSLSQSRVAEKNIEEDDDWRREEGVDVVDVREWGDARLASFRVDASLVLSLNDSNNNSGNNRNRNSERVKTVSTRTSCDHLAICWCKQVILSLAVALHRVAKAGGNKGFGDIAQYIKNIHVDIPPHLGWHGFEDASSTLKKKDNHGVFIDGFFWSRRYQYR